MAGGSQPGLATGRARGTPLRSGCRARGRRRLPLACPLWRTPGSGDAGRADGSPEGSPSSCPGPWARRGPRGHGREGWGTSAPSGGAETRSRKPAERSAKGRRPVGGRGPSRLAGDVALTPPRGCRAVCAHLTRSARPPKNKIFRPCRTRWRSRAGGGFLRDPRRAGAGDDEGPTRVRQAQSQGCSFQPCAGRGGKHACLA